MRGNWDFIDMIKEGVACLPDDHEVLAFYREVKLVSEINSTKNKQSPKTGSKAQSR